MNPPAEIAIRPMRAADIPRVREIADALPAAPHWPERAYLAALDPEARPRRIALVAVLPQSGTAMGFAIASLLPPQAELETIAVAAEAQRRGIAQRLLAALATELKRSDVTEVLLEVRASNAPALAFYAALGFGESGRRPRYYADPEEDAILLGLKLD